VRRRRCDGYPLRDRDRDCIAAQEIEQQPSENSILPSRSATPRVSLDRTATVGHDIDVDRRLAARSRRSASSLPASGCEADNLRVVGEVQGLLAWCGSSGVGPPGRSPRRRRTFSRSRHQVVQNFRGKLTRAHALAAATVSTMSMSGPSAAGGLRRGEAPVDQPHTARVTAGAGQGDLPAAGRHRGGRHGGRTGLAADLGTENRADHRTGGGPDTTRIPSPRTR
jgi:hypothetical protein